MYMCFLFLCRWKDGQGGQGGHVGWRPCVVLVQLGDDVIFSWVDGLSMASW